MQKALLFIGIFCSYLGFSQDTIYTRSGSVIAAKVTEINQDEVKYKKAANPDGPTYVVNKNEIALIEYKNGTKDVFASSDSDSDSQVQAGAGNNPNYSRPNTNIIITPRIWVPHPRLYVRWRPYCGPRVRVRWWW